MPMITPGRKEKLLAAIQAHDDSHQTTPQMQELQAVHSGYVQRILEGRHPSAEELDGYLAAIDDLSAVLVQLDQQLIAIGQTHGVANAAINEAACYAMTFAAHVKALHEGATFDPDDADWSPADHGGMP